MAEIHGFGIDRVAAAAGRADPATVTDRWPVLRLENLDTDLPLPPEAVPATAAALTTAKANSWLPFTGDEDLRAAVADLLVDRAGHRYDPAEEIVITTGGTEAALDCLLATVDPGDEVILTDLWSRARSATRSVHTRRLPSTPCSSTSTGPLPARR